MGQTESIAAINTDDTIIFARVHLRPFFGLPPSTWSMSHTDVSTSGRRAMGNGK